VWRVGEPLREEAVVTVTSEIPTIVLVHGAWADATGFDPEIRALRDRGFTAIGFANRFAISLATRPTSPNS
jgi:pimeloyl-ACP methyl ester carboxylesterase